MKALAVSFFAALVILTAPLSANSTVTRPNVIFILADDLGYGDVGVFGQKYIRTPSIDRLAAEGTRYTDSYAGATVCAPSRCCLMTGYHGGHAAIRGNKEVQPEGQEPMPADTFTVAQLFKNAGYATGITGKWGLGYPGSASTPDKMGFDFFYGYNCQRMAHEYYPESLWRNDQRVPLDGKTYSDDVIMDETLGFIRRNQSRPFFLYLSSTLPHAKLQVPELGAYAGEAGWTDKMKTEAAMITRLDSDVGRVMALLAELKLDDNTLVFFCSDNGAVYRDELFTHSGELRGFKRDVYEGGLRSPSVVRWPGHVAAGAVSKQIWAFWDFLPTMAELTGQPIPAGIDGISVLPAIIEGKPVAHPPLYFEFHERGFDQAVRMGDWKAVRHGTKKTIELYNLSNDPSEQHDVAAEQPEVVDRIEAFLRTARVDSADWPIDERPRGHRQKAAPEGKAKNVSEE